MTVEGLVGTVVDTVSFPVEEGKVREFARAVGDPEPTAVPLTFAVVAGHWRDQGAMLEALGLALERVVVGGCEWEYHAPVRIGDRLRGTRVVAGAQTKERPGGTMTVLTLETRFEREDGVLAVVQRDTIIELP
ncbi:MAG: hypothetical protein QOF76_5269 [Solirubrobacteraceae bacterium]|jgi:acyl dehydratase|nr:hypothetical protein [Solirubrobacteraceae bacterium]